MSGARFGHNLIGSFIVILPGAYLPAQAQERVLRECLASVQDVWRSDADLASELARKKAMDHRCLVIFKRKTSNARF